MSMLYKQSRQSAVKGGGGRYSFLFLFLVIAGCAAADLSYYPNRIVYTPVYSVEKAEGEGSGLEEGEEIVPLLCDSESLLGLSPSLPGGLWTAMRSSDDTPYTAFQFFSGLSAPILEVHWWGLSATEGSAPICQRTSSRFSITFHQDADGTPGEVIYTETFAVPRQPTEYLYTPPGFPIYFYAVRLSQAISLSAGWVAIRGLDDDTCWFHWVSSDVGAAQAVVYNGEIYEEQIIDAALCLLPAPTLPEGEAEGDAFHSADQNNDQHIDISELLRVIQFFNTGGYQCDATTEDGYAPYLGARACDYHDGDYSPSDWRIHLFELLRIIQIFNSNAYTACPEGEDGFCLGIFK